MQCKLGRVVCLLEVGVAGWQEESKTPWRVQTKEKKREEKKREEERRRTIVLYLTFFDGVPFVVSAWRWVWEMCVAKTHVISIWNLMATLFVTFSAYNNNLKPCLAPCNRCHLPPLLPLPLHMSLSLSDTLMCELTWKILFMITFHGLTTRRAKYAQASNGKKKRKIMEKAKKKEYG